jgi:hypothetical protein
MTQKKHALDLLAQGAELNAFAADQLDDVNEAHLIVHGVMARAMRGLAGKTLAGLKQDLLAALARHARRRGAAACC